MIDRPVNPVRHRQTARAILEALQMAGGYALENSVLISYTNDVVKPPLTFAEEGVTLKLLSDHGFIRKVPDSLDAGLKQWVITELGRNHLASL
jgi:hypothetical protein